jgi:hypothetical protein
MHCEYNVKTLFGISSNDLQRLAEESAKAYSVPRRFEKKIVIAEKKQYYSFMRGSTEISLRQ